MSVRRSKHNAGSARMGAKMMTRAMGVLVAVGLLCGTVTASATQVTDTPVLDTNIIQGATGEGNGAVEGGALSGENSNGATGDGATGDSTSDNTSADSAAGDSNAGVSDSDNAGGSNTSDADNADSGSTQQDSGTVKAADDDFFENHTVKSDNPKGGTTVNMFDYWITNRDAADYVSDAAGQGNTGINQNHQFKFGRGEGNDTNGDGKNDFVPDANRWSGYINGANEWIDGSGWVWNWNGEIPVTGIVKNTLNNGYPQLAGTKGLTSTESLSYLFDDSTLANGKASYMDVQGLLQVGNKDEHDTDGADLEGYYYYNSQKNFASLDTTSANQGNSVKLYDNWAVNKQGGDSSENGQFFPFNTADQVFEANKTNDGKLVPKDIGSRCTASTEGCAGVNINHYFGMSMSTRFVQPTNGQVTRPGSSDKTDMTYHFAGDDDVWVFIDNVLVGDLGGIHDRASLDINFRTGVIRVNNERVGTLADMFEAADQSTGGFNGDTFGSNTYHTLSFFYLERGNSDSNMELRFNLKTVPENDVVKVDQNGDRVANATFKLYGSATDSEYKFKNDQSLIATGATDTNGNLTLMKANKELVSFDLLHRDEGLQYFILEETGVPQGYRKPLNDLWLEYVSAPGNPNTASGTVLSVTNSSQKGSLWNTGSMAVSKVSTTATTTLETVDNFHIDDPNNGIMFAVVLKRNKTENGKPETDTWYGVSGTPLTGWELTDTTSMQGVVDTFKNNDYANVFTLSSSGGYEVTIEDLPGNIKNYYYMLPEDEKNNAEYTIGYYYSEAQNVKNVNAQNTHRLESDAFARLFAANFYISNIKNQLYVQKVDDAGNPVNGAKFGLYKAEDVDDTGALKATAQPIDTLTTKNLIPENGLPDFDGAGVFPDTADQGTLLGPTGDAESVTYYLGEIAAPAGYVKSSKLTKVTVNQYGVFADAGELNDGIKVVRGAGYMLKSVATLGASPNIDDTLTWIKLTPKKLNEAGDGEVDAGDDTKSGRVVDGKIVPSSTVTNPLRLDYSAEVTALEYGPRTENGDLLYITDEGTPTVLSQQDCTPTGGEDLESCDQFAPNKTGVTRTSLGDLRLNALISGTVMVQVTNKRAGARVTIELNKKVDGADWDSKNGTVNFSFTLTRTDPADADNVNDKVTYETKDENGDAVAKEVGSVTSSTTADIRNGNHKTVPFPELTFHDAGEYTFSLTENDTDKPAEGWTYDKKSVVVNVSVTKDTTSGTMTAVVKYDNEDSVPLFVNMKYGPELPETGGTGTMSLIWGGLLLVGCSLAGLAYARRRW